jgi:DNA-binding transcriptional LysR family regulator
VVALCSPILDLVFNLPETHQCDFAICCKKCGENIPAPVGTMPDTWIVAECPLPAVKVMLRETGSSAQRNALRQGEIDAAIMYTQPDREFAHHELVPESLVFALSEAHLLAARESIALKEIADEIFVLPAVEVAELLYRGVLAECADAGFQPRHIQDVSTVQTALGPVSAGFGISILPASAHYIRREGVVLRPIRNSRLEAQLTLMWSPMHASPIIPKIKECLG